MVASRQILRGQPRDIPSVGYSRATGRGRGPWWSDGAAAGVAPSAYGYGYPGYGCGNPSGTRLVKGEHGEDAEL